MEYEKNILNHIEEAVFVYDSSGHIIFVNDYLLRHSIFSHQEILGFSAESLFETGKSNINIFEIVKKEKRTVAALQVFYQPGTGKYQKCLVQQTPILNGQGETEYIVGTIVDLESLDTARNYLQNHEDQVFFADFIPSGGSSREKMERPVCVSQDMKNLYRMAEKAAQSDATLLILGETGTGKEVMAQFIHRVSPRRNKPMVAVNCAAISENLLESELFGYAGGSFTGASAKGKKGLVEEADGGTLFLDEIDSLPFAMQGKLLRVLETHEVRPVGGQSARKVDFRVIAATNADLHERVREKKFREDLYFRLNIFPLEIPPLRSRKDDIPALTELFLNQFGRKYGSRHCLTESALERLTAYDWPGNVRELRNMLERLTLTVDDSIREIEEIPDAFFGNGNYGSGKEEKQMMPPIAESAKESEVPLKEQVRLMEKQIIQKAIDKYGSLGKAAKALDISKSSLIRKRDQ